MTQREAFMISAFIGMIGALGILASIMLQIKLSRA
jgi:hypothetical protein